MPSPYVAAVKKTLPVLVALVGSLALSSCGEGAKAEPKTPLATASQKCAPIIEKAMQEAFNDDAPSVDEMFVLDEDGRALVLQTPDPGGELVAGATLTATECVLKELDAPVTVASGIGQTTALAGVQETSWDDIEASWTYSAATGSSGLTVNLQMAD